MNRKYVAFDLEIIKEIPEGETDWKKHRPLGISVAVLWCSDLSKPHIYAANYTDFAAGEALSYLRYLVDCRDYVPLTWNGLSFDFDVLGEESKDVEMSARLAINHVDMMFHLFAIRGHYLGIDKCAKGLGLPGKTEGMSGALAPALWAQGEYQKVIDYCVQDCRTTLDVAAAIEEKGAFIWTSQKGRQNIVDVPRLLTVEEALRLPLPDTSWMTNPVGRESFMGWMK